MTIYTKNEQLGAIWSIHRKVVALRAHAEMMRIRNSLHPAAIARGDAAEVQRLAHEFAKQLGDWHVAHGNFGHC